MGKYIKQAVYTGFANEAKILTINKAKSNTTLIIMMRV